MAVTLALLCPLALLAPAASGCPYSIRDAGFIVRDPEPYRLFVFVKGRPAGERTALATLLEQATRNQAGETNLETAVVDVNQKPAPEALKTLEKLPAASRKQFPLNLLVSPRGKLLVLPAAAGADAESRADSLVRTVAESPRRTEVLPHLVAHWCVLLFVEGQDAGENARVASVLEAATRGIVGFATEMGQKVRQAPPVIRVPWRELQTTERVLGWGLDLDAGDPRQPRTAVLFGAGRRIGAALASEQISQSALTELFHLLGRNCTCTSDPTWLLGPAMPLVWTRMLQQQTRDALGFDPDSPAVANALSGVWTSLKKPDAARKPGDYVPDPGTGYIEFGVEPEGKPEPGAETPPPAEEREGNLRREETTVEQRSLRIVLEVIAGLTGIAIGGSAVLLWRRLRA